MCLVQRNQHDIKMKTWLLHVTASKPLVAIHKIISEIQQVLVHIAFYQGHQSGKGGQETFLEAEVRE